MWLFEEMTPETIKAAIFGQLESGLDTREGSFTSDMAAPMALELWKLYQSLGALVPIVYVDETSGPYIDRKCQNYGIRRKEGTRAQVELTFAGIDGVTVPAGARFLTASGLGFATMEDAQIAGGRASAMAQAQAPGGAYNVAAGTITRQAVSRYGLQAVTNETPAQGGTDQEQDKALVGRLYDHLQKPASSGNVFHYEQWAKEVQGVGTVRVTPLWEGPGTVKVLIAGPDRRPVDETVVAACAAHLEEVRPIGAAVTVRSARGLPVDVAARLTLEPGAAKETVEAKFRESLEDYLGQLALRAREVTYHRVGYLLMDTPGVRDFSDLTLGGRGESVALEEDQVPLCGEVVFS